MPHRRTLPKAETTAEARTELVGLDSVGPESHAGAKSKTTAGPRWSRIASDLAAEIERGRHVPGETLPSALEIAGRYGVNRHTVRQALSHLQDLGLVTVQRGRGTTVISRRVPYRIGRRVRFRSNLGAAGMAAGGQVVESRVEQADAETATLLRLARSEPVWVVRMVSRAADVAISTSVHRLSAARFPDLDRQLDAAQGSLTTTFRAYGIADYVRLSTRLTARMPDPGELTLLGLASETPVMQSFAVDGLPDGTPLQVVVAAFAGDRVEMLVEAEV